MDVPELYLNQRKKKDEQSDDTEEKKSFFGSSKDQARATELKNNGNTCYKNKRYYNAVKYYTQASFRSPWPLPQVLRQIDDCIKGLDDNVRTIIFEDLLKVQDVTEPYDSLPSLLAQCYGNRSAALFEMGQNEAVVTDVDRAIYAGYKKPQIFKLYKRKALALARLGKFWDARKVVSEYKKGMKEDDSELTLEDRERGEYDIEYIESEILSAQRRNVTTPDKYREPSYDTYVCDRVKTDTSPELGRHIRAIKEIPRGTCIMKETAHVSLLSIEYTYTHCAACLKHSLTLIPCILCVHPGYCSYECMYKAFRYHWLECKNAKEWGWMPWIAQLGMRMLFLSPKEAVTTIVKEGEKAHSIDAAIERAKKGYIKVPSSYLTVLNLIAHRGEYADDEHKNLIENEALKPVDVFKHHLIFFFDLQECHSRAIYDLIRYHMCQLRFNTCTISSNALATSEDVSEQYSVRDMVQQRLGYGIFLNASLFNHSCDPNVFFRFEGTGVRVVAHLGVHKGQELLFCYGPQIGRQKKAERQAILKRGYMFTCTCKACDSDDKTMIYKEHAWDALACPKCKGVIPVLVDNYRTNCLQCGEVFSLHKFFKQRDDARKLYDEGMQDKNLGQLLECERMQREVLYCSNLELAKTRDAIAYLFVTQGNFEEGFDYIMSSYEAVKDIFGIASIEATEELSKLTQVLFRCDNKANAIQTATNALPLLELYYGNNHIDVVQLKQLRRAVELGSQIK